jgi:Cdc6-like AAA superfamily ATPase
MPIQILEPIEPGTSASSASEKPPALIESEASKMLAYDLRRYCNCQRNGASYLIAGHRGSGKTTLVANSVERMLSEAARGELSMRPLLVQLLGPSLLPDSRDNAEPNHKNSVDSDEQTSPSAGETTGATPTANGMQHVLEQITLALYRALTLEITQAYRRRAASNRLAERNAELLELAAKLELDLDEYPGPARLREYWRRAGALRYGLLRGARGSRRLDRLGLQNGYQSFQLADQGLRELVALCTASEAYRRISGQINRKIQSKTDSQLKKEAIREWSSTVKDILAPLVALLTGGTVGAGVLVGSPSHPLAATVAGLVGALGASVVMKRSSSTLQQDSIAREDLFIPDLSVATLDRVLPILIDRLRAAGLAPIFVVDELDKVSGLSTRITDMVRRLKKLVAESAFFCFLTDRSYFEAIRRREWEVQYSIEYTYYTNQLFISYGHHDLHDYLGKILILTAPKKDPELPDPYSPPSAVSSSTTDDRTFAEEQADSEILPYILLHAAQMHVFDLRRQLSLLRSAGGEISLAPGLIRSRPRYRFELMIQVAIELLLDDREMQSELDRQPAFRRLAYDTLYYLTRQWDSGELELDLGSDEKKQQSFANYLISRMDTDPPVTGSQNAGAPTKVDENQLKFLLQKVRELALLLSTPLSIRKRAAESRLPQIVIDALPLAALLMPMESQTHCYRWRYHRSGRRATPPGGFPEEVLDWAEAAKLISHFAAAVKDLTTGSVDLSALSSQFGVIGTSPSWIDVQGALGRLNSASAPPQDYPEKEFDVAVVLDYADLLKKCSKTVALALCCAKVLEAWVPKGGPANLIAALDLMARAFRLRDVHEQIASEHLAHLLDEVNKLHPAEAAGPLSSLTEAGDVIDWKRNILESSNARRIQITNPENDLNQARATAWEYWFRRFKVGSNRPLNLDNILCALHSCGPFSILDLDINQMTAHKWSEAFAHAVLAKSSRGEEAPPPHWLAVEALSQLGFPDLAKYLAESGASDELRRLLLGKDKADLEFRLRDAPQRPLLPGTPLRAVIVTWSDDSVALKWLPSPKGAALVLTRNRLFELVEHLNERSQEFFRLLRITSLIFDPIERSRQPSAKGFRISSEESGISLSEDRDRVQIQRFFGFDMLPMESQRIGLLLREWPTTELLEPYFPIVGATTLDEVLTRVQRVTGPFQ